MLVWQNINASEFTQQIENLKKDSLKTAPNILALEAKKNQSNADVYSNYTNHLPNLLFNLKKQKNFFESTSPLVKTLGLSTPQYAWSIDYQWSIFNYSNFLNSTKSLNQSSLDSLEYENSLKNYDIEFNTSLLNVILSKYKKATIGNSIKKAETAKKEASLGFTLGQKTKIDVLRSEANYISLTSKNTTILDEEQNAKSKFIETTGLEESTLVFLDKLNEDQLINLIDDLAIHQKNESQLDLNKSPVYKKLELEIKNNDLDANLITRNEWPELKLQGSLEHSANTINGTFHQPSRSHSVALVLSIPLFNGGSLISNNFEQYFAKKRIAYISNLQINQLRNSFNNNSIKINALETLVKSLKLNVDQFEELYRLTTKSYQLGKSTLFELLEVQDNLLDSKINLATSKIQLYNLTNTYNWQLGSK
jgi:outer membrane protein TolC